MHKAEIVLVHVHAALLASNNQSPAWKPTDTQTQPHVWVDADDCHNLSETHNNTVRPVPSSKLMEQQQDRSVWLKSILVF